MQIYTGDEWQSILDAINEGIAVGRAGTDGDFTAEGIAYRHLVQD